MNLPNKPVPRDVYDIACRLVKETPVKPAEKKALLAWCELDTTRSYRQLAASVVIHNAALNKGS